MQGAGSVLPQLVRDYVIPVVRTRETALARRAVEWLAAAGFRTFEITMTVPDAVALIAEASAGGLLVGAGTVTDAATARRCIEAGARFVVSPAVVPEVAAACREKAALSMLGALTPTEVIAAVRAGADVVKIFPASSVGGPAHVKALRSVFPDVPLVPTGGISADEIAAYRAAGAACVGLGGKLVDEKALAANDRAAIDAVARRIRHEFLSE